MSIYPGLRFYAEVIPSEYPCLLTRTASTYGYGDALELSPRQNDLYVVCLDGSIQSVWNPERPIGWELVIKDGLPHCRVSQMGFEPQLALVRYHSEVDPPCGRGGVGSRVEVPQDAVIYETDDGGEPEVSSPECPDAPRKASRNEYFS